MHHSSLIRVLSTVSLAGALLASACESTAPYNPADGSGGDCDNTPGVACTWVNKYMIRGFGSHAATSSYARNQIGNGQPIADSWLDQPADVSFGPDGTPYVVDWNNHQVRMVQPDGTFTTLIGTLYEGDGPPDNADRLPVGNPMGCAPNTVALNHPTDVKFMPDGSIVLAAWHDNKIRVVDPTKQVLKILAGDNYGYGGDGGPAYAAILNRPKSIAIDASGRIYFVDQVNERIRVIDTDATRTIMTLAGNGTKGYKGDGTNAPPAAEFDWDNGVNTPDPSGAVALWGHELYIADSIDNRIRKLDLDTSELSCVAGAGCPITSPLLQYPMDLEFGADGRLYIAERDGNEIDALDLTAGTISPYAGNGKACTADPCVETDKHPTALEVQFNWPQGFTFDPKGNLYVADTLNSRVVRIAAQ
jgi:sugar lactone lactonase YvrE